MRSLVAAAFAMGALCLASPANADPGLVSARVNVRAGPGVDFPRVAALRRGAHVDVRGCVPDRDWCDVAWPGGRGWLSTRYLEVDVGGRRGAFWDNRARVNVATQQWNFDNYWNENYRNRDFYRNREQYRGRGPQPGPDGGPPPPPHSDRGPPGPGPGQPPQCPDGRPPGPQGCAPPRH